MLSWALKRRTSKVRHAVRLIWQQTEATHQAKHMYMCIGRGSAGKRCSGSGTAASEMLESQRCETYRQL